jgi:V/A-type H+-transporting ATPase subunit C
MNLEDIKKAVFEEDYAHLSKTESRLFKEINSKVKNVNNPRLVSAIVENNVFQYLFRSLEQTPSVALKTYFQSFVDFANVMTFIRSKNMKWNINQFYEMFVDGGLLQRTLFSQIYDSNHEEILHSLSDYYQGKITKGVKVYYENHELTNLERYFDQIILEIMKAFRYDSFNIGPIVYYFLKKQAEAKNIRLIYANKDIDVSELLDY